MDNHFHIIIENRIDLANKLTDKEIVFRWLLLHPTKEAKKAKRVEPTSDEINEKLWLMVLPRRWSPFKAKRQINRS